MVIVNYILNVLLLIVIFMFTFNSSPLFRSVLILMNSLVVSILVFIKSGFSWYFLLFILVYIGGIYIILIYISMIFPNFSFFNVKLVSYFFMLSLFFVFLSCILWSAKLVNTSNKVDCSFYLCNSVEVLLYIFLCMMLMISLVFVNFIVSSAVVKLSYR
uniref:NADH dehydrogenase subunit 6 n=2 Tax=Platyhelminthes TaxID=6157 RepID=A0A2Z5QP47_SCHMD|nr:NADH dehydrogenase subunit 6 [Schistosoma mattheei]